MQSSKAVQHSLPVLYGLATPYEITHPVLNMPLEQYNNPMPSWPMSWPLLWQGIMYCRRHKEVSYLECKALWQEAQASGCSLFGQLCESPLLLTC